MNKELALSIVGVIAIGVMLIGLLNMVVLFIEPPSFEKFVHFGMTLPAAVSTTSNAAAIFILTAFLRARRN